MLVNKNLKNCLDWTLYCVILISKFHSRFDLCKNQDKEWNSFVSKVPLIISLTFFLFLLLYFEHANSLKTKVLLPFVVGLTTFPP